MVTIGSQASGETGRKICTIGLIAAFTVDDSPATMPSGIATAEAITKPNITVRIEVQI